MANYQQLIYNISNYIKENHSNDITGSVLQNILLSIVSSVGGYKYMGVASTSGHPETPDYNIFYIAYSQNGGTYPYYGNITLNANEFAILKYNGSWSKDSIGTISGGGSSINVVDNLTTDSGTDALSARQGMLLNNGIELINDLINQGAFLEIAQVKGNSTLQLNDFIPNSEGTLEIPIATVNGLGLVRPDGTTITINNGVLTVVGGGGGDSVNWGSIGGTLSNQSDLSNALNGKQATLESGVNIKTVNGSSLLGSGNLVISGGTTVNVVNNLSSTSTTDALSANMGRELNNNKADKPLISAPTGTSQTVNIIDADFKKDTRLLFSNLTSLSIPNVDILGCEVVIEFTTGSTFTFSTSASYKYVGDNPKTFNFMANSHYVIVVRYGIVVVSEIKTQS